MRITGGELGGRVLQVPKSGAIRPTQDRVREALFSMLQCEVPGATVLDMFAGTGSFGLDAISRGAARATFVEANAKHLETLRSNVETLGKASVSDLVRGDAYRYISSYSGAGFDIAFADPPYALGEEKGYASVLKTLSDRGVVRPGGIFVAEMTSAQSSEKTLGWELLRDRTYGRTRICVWRRTDGGHLP